MSKSEFKTQRANSARSGNQGVAGTTLTPLQGCQPGHPQEAASGITNDWRLESIRQGVEEVRRRVQSQSQANANRIGQLLNDVMPLLRSKPEDPNAIATNISAATQDPESAGILAVLASPTAEQEGRYFLKFADIFRRQLCVRRLDVVLVRWEYLIDRTGKTDASRQQEFDAVVVNIRDMINDQGWDANLVHAVNITLGNEPESIIESPSPFSVADTAVREAAKNGGGAIPSDALVTDLKWVVDYYGRQHSLKPLGTRQPLLDLAIRREIGRAVSAGSLWCGRQLAPHRLCLTSELNPRLVKCYRFKSANVNIAFGNN